MKILCVNSTISETGGAELAAMNLARGLAARGHDLHFLGSRRSEPSDDSTACERGDQYPEFVGDIRLHYESFPRPYALGEVGSLVNKAIWHLRDLADPENEWTFESVLDRVQPDAIILHSITAIGLNIWRSIRRANIPCIQVIHDLGLICFNVARFRRGRQCTTLCFPCRIQKCLRVSMIAGARNFAFVSPAHATLQEITRFADLSAFRQAVIPYPNTFFVKPKKVTEGQKAKLLYVGRLDPSKGLRMLLSAASVARRTVLFELDVLGTGSLEKELRQAYQQCDWVKFHGNVPQESVAEFMSRSTVLLVPSQWLENAPLVIMHALFAGLPVLGSSIGGIPEYVDDGRTGRLLPPDDELAWSTEIARVVADPTQLANWSAACPEFARQFDPKVALDAYEKLIEAIVSDLDRASA